MRRCPPAWTVEQIPGGFKVKDANGQSLVYVCGRESEADADTAHVLTMDEARRIASDIAKPAHIVGLASKTTNYRNPDGFDHWHDHAAEFCLGVDGVGR